MQQANCQKVRIPSWRAFSHSVRTAPIITLFIPGTPLKTTHLQNHAWSIQSSMGCRIQDPGTHGYRWWKTADFSHSGGTAHGGLVSAQILKWNPTEIEGKNLSSDGQLQTLPVQAYGTWWDVGGGGHTHADKPK